MRLIISGKDFPLTPSLKEFVRNKFSRFDRHSHPILEARVELDVDHNQRSGDIFRATAHLILGKRVVKAGVKAPDMHAAVDELLPKLERQLERLKGKSEASRRT